MEKVEIFILLFLSSLVQRQAIHFYESFPSPARGAAAESQRQKVSSPPKKAVAEYGAEISFSENKGKRFFATFFSQYLFSVISDVLLRVRCKAAEKNYAREFKRREALPFLQRPQLKLCFPISLNPGSPRRRNLLSFIDFISSASSSPAGEKKESCLRDWKPPAQSSRAGRIPSREVVWVAVFWLRSESSEKGRVHKSRWFTKKKTNERSHPPPMIHLVQSNHPLCLRVREGWRMMLEGTHEDGWRKVPRAFGLFMNYGFEFAENNSVIRGMTRERAASKAKLKFPCCFVWRWREWRTVFHANKRQFH